MLALPKLNLQFLTFADYLLRNFNLFRLEATYEIREDLADVLKRVGPYPTDDGRVRGMAEWVGCGVQRPEGRGRWRDSAPAAAVVTLKTASRLLPYLACTRSHLVPATVPAAASGRVQRLGENGPDNRQVCGD